MTTRQLTKAQQYSLTKIWDAISVIERIVPQEQQRFSQQRKRWLEKALDSLRLHAGKLDIHLPNLGLMYLPEKYTQQARFVREQLQLRGLSKPERTLDELLALKENAPRPHTYCLCGSTDKAAQAFQAESLRLTLAGHKVLSIGANTKDSDLGITEAQKIQLDILHLFKIEDADVIRILNVGGYIGESTRRELEYARRLDKRIEFLEQSYLLKWKIRGERFHSLAFTATEDQALQQFLAQEALLSPLDEAVSVELFVKGNSVPHRQILFTPGRRGQKQQEAHV